MGYLIGGQSHSQVQSDVWLKKARRTEQGKHGVQFGVTRRGEVDQRRVIIDKSVIETLYRLLMVLSLNS